MDSLPEHLTRDILSKVGVELRGLRDLANFSAACKAFHSVNWPVLQPGHGSAEIKGALLSRHMSGVQGIRIWVRNEADWLEWKVLIEKSSSTLEDIFFGYFSRDTFDKGIWLFLEKFPRLSSIRLNCEHEYVLPCHSFPKLRSAHLTWKRIRQDDIQNLLKSAPLLETLELSCFGAGGGRIVVEGCNLKVFKADISGVDLTVAKCERLETLHVSFVKSLALGYESLPSLRNIEWSYIKGTLYSLLLSGLSDVENLVIAKCKLAKGCQVLTIPGDKLKTLDYNGPVKKLRVERCDRLESLDVSRAKTLELGGSCPRLRKASLRNMKNFGNKQLSRLLLKSPRLRELEIEKCSGSLLRSSITLCSSSLEKLYFRGERKLTTLNIKCNAFRKLRLCNDGLVELADDRGNSIPTRLCLNGYWSKGKLMQFTRLAFITKLLNLKLDIGGTLEEKARIAVRVLSRSVCMTTVTMVADHTVEVSDLEKAVRHLASNAFRFSPQLQRITFDEIPVNGSNTATQRIQQALEEISFRGFSCRVTSIDFDYYRVDVLRS